MNLSSLRPYEVTDFGETTIHGDDQAKNEELYWWNVSYSTWKDHSLKTIYDGRRSKFETK